jgi:hypothetical protein
MIDAATLAENLNNPAWRIANLYKIVAKSESEDEPGLVIQFIPNTAQRRLLARLHYRNVILKARQLGFSTLVCILWLDTALFSKDPVRCGIIAQDKESAEALFRGKVKFAYDHLPDELRAKFPLSRENTSELEFGHNGASIRVATSMRSGTIHRLLVSEFGKICAKYPDKAKEVVTGSIPAVPSTGILVIESTAEGQDGEFYKITQRALDAQRSGKILTAKDYRMHFFAWWEAPEYAMDPTGVIFTDADRLYFQKVETIIKRKLSLEQRAWYVTTVASDFSGDAPSMWQEYPSYEEEAFAVSTEGCYYSAQLAKAREQGRVLARIPLEPVPVNTFWDLGKGDMLTQWFHQQVGLEDRFIRYYENSGEDLSHYVTEMLKHGYVFGTHFLPHDAEHKRLGLDPDNNDSILEMLQKLLPGHRFEVIPRITNIQAGIQQTRDAFSSAVFDETYAGQGLIRLANYRKRWNKALGCWSLDPMHDDNSHGADGFRQWGQAKTSGIAFLRGPAKSGGFKRRGSPMAV